MPVQEILETVRGGGIAVIGLIGLLIVLFAPLVYITVLGQGPSHKRLLQLVRLLRTSRRPRQPKVIRIRISAEKKPQ